MYVLFSYLQSSENFVRTSSLNKKLRRSFSSEKSENISGTEGTQCATESEDVKKSATDEGENPAESSDRSFITMASTSSAEMSLEVS